MDSTQKKNFLIYSLVIEFQLSMAREYWWTINIVSSRCFEFCALSQGAVITASFDVIYLKKKTQAKFSDPEWSNQFEWYKL